MIRHLLAIDVGLRSGFALYEETGRLLWYRSHHFGNRSQLRRRARALLTEIPDLSWVVIEGSGPLAEIWIAEAGRLDIPVRQISAEVWRPELLYPREQRRAAQAKRTADALARRVIEWSEAPRPTSLRHDAAEAILVGLWGLIDIGWLKGLPDELQR